MKHGVRSAYTAGDLINYNGGKNSGLVLQVHEDYLKVINEQSKLVNVKILDVGKRIAAQRPGAPISARDAQGNSLAIDQMVKVHTGQMKGMSGPIRHFDRNYLFLWNKDCVQSNGIFVESCRNVIILGAEFMKGTQGQAIASQNRFVKDALVGKLVVIVGGKFKGHRGRVCFADDKVATVELST